MGGEWAQREKFLHFQSSNISTFFFSLYKQTRRERRHFVKFMAFWLGWFDRLPMLREIFYSYIALPLAHTGCVNACVHDEGEIQGGTDFCASHTLNKFIELL